MALESHGEGRGPWIQPQDMKRDYKNMNKCSKIEKIKKIEKINLTYCV